MSVYFSCPRLLQNPWLHLYHTSLCFGTPSLWLSLSLSILFLMQILIYGFGFVLKFEPQELCSNNCKSFCDCESETFVHHFLHYPPSSSLWLSQVFSFTLFSFIISSCIIFLIFNWVCLILLVFFFFILYFLAFIVKFYKERKRLKNK